MAAAGCHVRDSGSDVCGLLGLTSTANTGSSGQQLTQKLQAALPPSLVIHEADTRHIAARPVEAGDEAEFGPGPRPAMNTIGIVGCRRLGRKRCGTCLV